MFKTVSRTVTVSALAALSLPLLALPPSQAVAAHRDIASVADAQTDGRNARARGLKLTRITKGLVESGDKVAFTVAAPKSWQGLRVRLMQRSTEGASWRVVSRKTLPKSGIATIKGTATGSGTNWWKAVVRRDGTSYPSASVRHKVFSWFYLNALETAGEWDPISSGPAAIGGVIYPNSVGGYINANGSSGYFDYNLSYRCQTFETWIGVTDDSESGFSATFSIALDGAVDVLGTKGLGSATYISRDVASRLRLRLDISGSGDEFEGEWRYANARVLCAGKP